MEMGRRIRVRRAALGWSQRDLAERSGVKQPLISAIESGRRQPTAETQSALEAALRVRPSEVLRHLRSAVLDVIHAHRGSDPWVFGSVARGSDGPDSDLDLLVTFPPDAGITSLLAMEEELSDLLTVPVEVVSTGSSGRVLTRALAEAVPL